jgi:hypothetical protein
LTHVEAISVEDILGKNRKLDSERGLLESKISPFTVVENYKAERISAPYDSELLKQARISEKAIVPKIAPSVYDILEPLSKPLTNHITNPALSISKTVFNPAIAMPELLYPKSEGVLPINRPLLQNLSIRSGKMKEIKEEQNRQQSALANNQVSLLEEFFPDKSPVYRSVFPNSVQFQPDKKIALVIFKIFSCLVDFVCLLFLIIEFCQISMKRLCRLMLRS